MTAPALPVERLHSMPLAELRARRALAETGFIWSQVVYQRLNAKRDMDTIDAELKRRGYQVTA